MIQTSFFPELQNDNLSKTPFSSLYKIRYVHLKTGLVLKRSSYFDGEKNKRGRAQYFYNNEWVFEDVIPEGRERRRLRESTVEFFMRKLKTHIKGTNKYWKSQNRKILGVNEFEDRWNCCDKISAHFHKQVEKYGYKCPITHIDFTTIRKNGRLGPGKERIISNISPDRLFDHINYTKQNVLFTSQGWNVARMNFSLEDIGQLFPTEFGERYKKIVRERFPDNPDYK